MHFRCTKQFRDDRCGHISTGISLGVSFDDPRRTASTTVWTVDPAHAELAFSVRHLMIYNVRGRFGKVEGTVTVDEENPTTRKIDVTIDVNSIDTRQEMRDNHLRSADFFDAANFPTMRFVSKRIDGDVLKDFQIIGDLTIRGTTREVELECTPRRSRQGSVGERARGLQPQGKLNRHDFGLTGIRRSRPAALRSATK